MPEAGPQTVEQCDGCKFYRLRVYGQASVGECRYSDPMPQGQAGFWPTVKADDWCGKYVAGP